MKNAKQISPGDYDVVKYENFHELLKGIYDNYSEKTAIRYRKNGKETSITYDALIGQISDLYYFYKNNNIQDCNIGILSENRYEYVTIYLASVFQNVIAPIDRELTADGLASLINKFDIKVLFYTDKTKGKLDTLPGKDTLKLINIDADYQTILQDHYAPDLFFKDTEHTDSHKFSVLAFTSGTTGAIKGAMLSQRNIVSNLRAPLLYMHLESPMLQLLPMNHMYGFHPDLLSPLYNGDTICINMALKDIAKDFKYYDPYYIGVVPVMLEGIYKNIIREARRQNKEKLFYRLIKISNRLRKCHIDIRRLLFQNLINKRLRIIVCGGAFLDPVYIDRFEEIGITVLNGYGMTECAPLISVNRDRHNIRGSAGAVIQGTKVKIADDGEILVKGWNVMSGYYNDEEETELSFVDGYYKTGDIGYLDDDILYVTGRKKNLIILKNGKNFSPEVIEKELLRLPYIKECLVMADIRNSAEIIIAKILLDSNADNKDNVCNQSEVEQLKKDMEAINRTLPSYMRIDDFEIVSEEFEKTSSKKIIRSKYVVPTETRFKKMKNKTKEI
ncbi:MAG: AMP-binding protein [Lachnospiraceae bacterium]|nr:AMP-binding protein [Lachnospiraceae bacterium]